MTLITIRQAAEQLGIDESQVRRYIREGKLPSQRFSARIQLIDIKDLEKVAEKPRVGRPRGSKK